MKGFEVAGLPGDEMSRFVRGTHSDPFSVLGPHRIGENLEVRVFRPDAREVELVLDSNPEKPITAQRIQRDGFFCAIAPGATRDVGYRRYLDEKTTECAHDSP